MKKRVTKTIEVYKHPYMWKVNVEFGTLEDMLENCYHWVNWDGLEVSIGGSFNRRMNSGRRAALVQIAVQLIVDTYSTEDGTLKVSGVKSARGIRKNPWEGTYCYNESLFDSMIEQGLYPVRADWDGKTFIERGKYDENKRWQRWYEQTDTYRY